MVFFGYLGFPLSSKPTFSFELPSSYHSFLVLGGGGGFLKEIDCWP